MGDSRIGEIMRSRVRLGERDKIVALCQQYVQIALPYDPL